MTAAWDRYWFDPILAARVWCLRAGTLMLLALDVWSTRIGPAWRYGAGDFNVAHFAWLDDILPPPTAGLQVAAVVLIGLGAFVAAVTPGGPRAILAALVLLHTWSWAASMQDSYQHHYLLSWVLAALLFLPRLSTGDVASARGESLASTWAYVLVGVTCSIVYLYGACAKLTPEWLDGSVLSRMTGGPAGSLFGPSVALAELLCCLGYALAPFRDRERSRFVAHVCTVALLAALVLHLGAERLDLGIGCFSWYMILFALVFFMPGASLSRAVSFLGRPASALAAVEWRPSPGTAAVAAGLAVACLALVGRALDLPGAFPACFVAGIVGGLASARAPRLAITSATAAAVLWLAVALSGGRYDFYRFGAGDARRRQDAPAALASYLKAERYAPAGETRAHQIAELRKLLD